MTTITLKINDKSKVGKAFLAYLEELSIESKSVKIINTPNLATLKSIADIESKNNLTKAQSPKELLRKLRA